MKYLDDLLKYLAQQQIKVVVFDLPLTDAYRRLLPEKFWTGYDKNVSEICQKRGADHLNIDADWKAFTNQDFMDSVHLNLPGGLKLTRPIALFAANKFHLRTFEELRGDEKKMF